MSTIAKLSGIEYSGIAGCTEDCLDAVKRILQYGEPITVAQILTCATIHCLLLKARLGDFVAIKSGFASGYRGEGSHGFSQVLMLLEAHGAEIDEFIVDRNLIRRIDMSALTIADMENLASMSPVRPRRWHDYMFEREYEYRDDGKLWSDFPDVIPFSLIDARITDLAIAFWDDPDAKLLSAYRRLEDTVRDRTGLTESGAKLFAKAFLSKEPKLVWTDVEDSEQDARATLFTAVYRAYRNRRAHRAGNVCTQDCLDELLLINHLFRLERVAKG